MASVVTNSCTKCTEMNCLSVCPVEAFHEDAEMLIIDPVACIDCGACVPECPVHAIYAEEDMPEQWKQCIEMNARRSKELPIITELRKL